MPIFEFVCDECKKRFSALVGVLANARTPACPQCGGERLTKQVSRFARVRTEDDAIESLADETVYGDIENDPKAMKKWVRDMGSAMDEDLDDEFEQAMEEEMSGKSSAGGSGGKTDDTVY